MSENKLKERYHIGDIVEVTDSGRANVDDDTTISEEFRDFNANNSRGHLEIYLKYDREGNDCYKVKNADNVLSDEGYHWEELRLIQKHNQQWDN